MLRYLERPLREARRRKVQLQARRSVEQYSAAIFQKLEQPTGIMPRRSAAPRGNVEVLHEFAALERPHIVGKPR